jgi:hypothetical protein
MIAVSLPSKVGGGITFQRVFDLTNRVGHGTVCTLLDQAHNAIERKLFMMKAFHHPRGSQQAFLTGLAHLYNLILYQRRAKHAGQCGVEVEGGKDPTQDWFLNLQILTSGGLSLNSDALHH